MIDRLREAMERDRVLEPASIARAARESGIPEAAAYGVATYYGDFSLSRRGKTRVRVCVGTACMASRGDGHVRDLEAALGVRLGETRADGEVSLEPVYCLGLCHAAPAAMLERGGGAEACVRTLAAGIDGATSRRIAELDAQLLAEPEPRPRFESRGGVPIVLRNLVGGADASTLRRARERGAYEALRVARATRSPSSVLDELATSMLRGRGGAGFSTAQKWRTAAAAPGADRWVVCNADEGDPGSYIDKWLLELDPHAVLEGMALAAFAIGASRGAIFVRSEYPRAVEAVRRAVDEARALLGGFAVRVVEGAGSYVSGEETSLLRGIEGLRGMVSARPPYPAERGVFEAPTVVHNVETLVNLPWIAGHGGDAYARVGVGRSRGTKALSLNSLFTRPGLYEVPLGTPLREVFEDLAGGLASGLPIKAAQIGGPLGGVLPASLFDTPLGFEELDAVGGLLGHGGIVAFPEGTDMRALARHLFAFGDDESCGKCFPCRLGMRRGREMFDGALDLPLMDELLETMRYGSLCAHGSGLPLAISSIVRHWPEELAR